MAIPDYFIQELKNRIDIGDVVSSYVTLKKRGKNLLGLCPFHSEKSPSFNVSSENGYFHCFGCGAGGDVITFIRQIENLDYVEAVKFLADKAGMQMPESGVDDSLSKLRTRVLEINRETARFYHKSLMSAEGQIGLDYFRNRALSLKTIKSFGLGFAPTSRFALVNHLRSLGYKKEEMEAANVAFISRNGNPIDRFVGRVMFPIIDLRGNVVAFGGRALGDEKPKYINSSDTPVYHKSSGLFAMNFAKNSGEKLILAEGYMDVIALHAAGFTGAIASLGTALTTQQSQIIARYAKEVVICYDSDAAGQKATQRAIPILRATGIDVKVLTVPGGKDPDEFMKNNGENGPARFKMLLDNCGNDLEYRFSKLKTEIDITNSNGKVQYLTAAAEILGELDNPIEKEVYAGRLSQELGVDKFAILEQAKKQEKVKLRQKEKERQKRDTMEFSGRGDKINPDKAKNLKIANAEEALIGYIFAHPDGLDYCKSKIDPEKFCTQFCKRVYSCILGKDIGSNGISLTDISGDFSPEEIAAITKIVVKFSEITVSRRDVDKYIETIVEDGVISNTENIKNLDSQQLADYFQSLRKRK